MSQGGILERKLDGRGRKNRESKWNEHQGNKDGDETAEEGKRKTPITAERKERQANDESKEMKVQSVKAIQGKKRKGKREKRSCQEKYS